MRSIYAASVAAAALLSATPALAQDGQSTTTTRDDSKPATAKRTDQTSPPNQDIIVTGTREQGYRAIDSNALGIGLDLKETPATVNVITEQFIKDTGAHRLSDIITYTPGVVNNEKSTSLAEYYIVRGFGTSLTYLNGVRQTYSNSRRGLATIARVQVVKGPAGAEAGVADPGGTIDIVTKMPQPVFGASFDAGWGDYNYRTVSGDITGPIALDGKLQARLVGGYQQSVTWRAGQRPVQPFVTISPTLKLDYAASGSVYVQYEYDYSKEYFDRGVLHLAGYYPSGFGPRQSSSVNSELNFATTKSQRFEAGLDQRFGPFTLTLRYQRLRDTNDGAQLDGEPQSGDIYKVPDPATSIEQQAIDSYTWNGTGYTIPFFYGTNKNYRTRTNNFAASLKADFGVFGIRNTVIGGYEHNTNFAGGLLVGPIVSNVLDIRAPNNNQTPVITGPSSLFDQSNNEQVNSFYVKWVARPSDRLRLFGAARWDRYKTAFDYTYSDGLGYSEGGPSGYGQNLFSYRIAASFDVTDAITTFVGYANGFIPQSGFTRTGPIPALRGRSLEGGVKISLAGGRALWTNTVYSIRQDNLTIEDPTNVPPQSFVVLFGAVRSRGFESELSGTVLPGLELQAGLSVLETKVVENNAGYLGKRFLNVPNIQGSAFASYNLAAVRMKPLTLRLGFTALGNREGNPENTFKLPGYVRVDAGAGYRVNKRLNIGFAIENLLNKTYYVAADQGGLGGGTISVGNRRLVQATLGYKF